MAGAGRRRKTDRQAAASEVTLMLGGQHQRQPVSRAHTGEGKVMWLKADSQLLSENVPLSSPDPAGVRRI